MSVQDRLPVVAVTDDHTMVKSEISSPTRVLAPNEFLFRTGDAKTCLYRVNSGAVCLYEQSRNEHRSPVDFAFPGDFVGLGFLGTHTCCARAVTKTEVACLPLEALASAMANNPKAQAKFNDAIEREFKSRRAALVKEAVAAPLSSGLRLS